MTNAQNFLKIVDKDKLEVAKRKKLEDFIKIYQQKFNKNPEYVVCCPGRVNLIGDHVDYHGFAVLPMAIENSIWLGCSFTNNKDSSKGGDNQNIESKSSISLLNVDEANFPKWTGTHTFAHGVDLNKSHKWEHYFLCGYHGVLANKLLNIPAGEILKHANQLSSDKQLLSDSDNLLSELNDLQVLVDSDLPSASGLSSSSALVCASAIITQLLVKHSTRILSSQQQNLDTLLEIGEMAECCSKFEHLIGTQGGGMDQAVIMTAQQSFAKHVEFVPRLRCENVRLPDNIVWLVSHCGSSYSKAATDGYNTRVLETKLGASLIAKKVGFPDSIKLDSTITLHKVKDILFDGKSTQEITEYIRIEVFENTNQFTVEQICFKLEITREELIARFNTSDKLLKSLDTLNLMLRCEHVLEEAERVKKFKSICDTTTDVNLLGTLMTQSHYSLAYKYNCSCPSLDRLVSVALDAGALGSRLTGAGWGGCVVTLVETAKCDTVFERLAEVSKFTFRTQPQAGCSVIRIQTDQ